MDAERHAMLTTSHPDAAAGREAGWHVKLISRSISSLPVSQQPETLLSHEQCLSSILSPLQNRHGDYGTLLEKLHASWPQTQRLLGVGYSVR
jgi:hypothetical protein